MDKNIKTSTGLILAMCYIIDQYEGFNKNLNEFKKKNKIDQLAGKIIDVTTGKKVFGARKVKKFYEENKNVIDKINKVYYISNFIYFYEEGKEQIYQYLIKNRDKIDYIINVLEKLKKIGINDIVINEEFDFTKEEYMIYDGFYKYRNVNVGVTYLDNIEVIPEYDSNKLKYKTTNSNYKLVFGGFPDKIIYVNILAFDSERLPDTKYIGDLIGLILSKKEDVSSERLVIKNSVNLSLGIEDLVSMLCDMDKVVDSLDCFDDKEKIVEILSSIRDNITKIEDISKKYDNHIIEHYNDRIITKENLDKEKTLEKSRRYRASQHWD